MLMYSLITNTMTLHDDDYYWQFVNCCIEFMIEEID